MKNKYFALLFVILALMALFFLLLRGGKLKLALVAEVPDTNAPVMENTTQSSVVPPQTDLTVNVATPKEDEHEPTTEAEANAKIRKMLEAQNKPIELWAEVEDQDNVPLSGVKVEAEIGHFVWPPDQYPNGVSSNRELVTDASGQFHIQDKSATSVGVTLQKDGYEQESPEGRGYALGTGGGTKDNPVVLRMWSTNILQKLVTGEMHFHATPDGRPYFINLTDDTISESEGGDLKVWIQYTNQVVQGQFSDWSCGIDVVNGGLLEETNLDLSTMFIAPSAGYGSPFRLKQQIEVGQSGSIGDKRFYLMLKNGQEYGRVQIDLIAPYDRQIPGLIRLSYVINPSGSRILR
jgi:hypothetical protein